MNVRQVFRTFYDQETAGMSRAEKARTKLEWAGKLDVTINVINDWIGGQTVPNKLERRAINFIFRKEVY